MKKHIIIVAGGKGLRMGGDIPKQFLPICGKPVLMRTIEAFYTYDADIHVVLVLPASQQSYWKDLCVQYRFDKKHDIANGGETRFHSVMNGLALVEGEGWVGVHDGVRPFVSKEVISRCYAEAMTKKAVITGIEGSSNILLYVCSTTPRSLPHTSCMLFLAPARRSLGVQFP